MSVSGVIGLRTNTAGVLSKTTRIETCPYPALSVLERTAGVLSKTTRIETPRRLKRERPTRAAGVLSKTTRIETQLPQRVDAGDTRAAGVLSKTTRIETGPRTLRRPGRLRPPESYPRQQGLKRLRAGAFSRGHSPPESYPRQQGLKPGEWRRTRRSGDFVRRSPIQDNKD